jgi:hypothetical protein
MRNLLRKPLPWIVLAECFVVAALVMVAWHLVANPPAQSTFTSRQAFPTTAAGHPSGSSPQLTPPRRQMPALLPGLNVNADFWRVRLAELNRGEAAFEALEWRLVHAAMDAAHRYVESVVLPTIARAERGGR